MDLRIIFEIIVLSLTALAALFMVILATGPNAVYMFLMENKEWRMWRFIRKNLDKFVLDEKKFTSSAIYFVWNDYRIIVWNDIYDKAHASVHYNNDCVCSNFWSSESKHLAEKLLKINACTIAKIMD